MVMTSKFCNELEILLNNRALQAILAVSSHLQFAARNSILIHKTCTES